MQFVRLFHLTLDVLMYKIDWSTDKSKTTETYYKNAEAPQDRARR